MVAFTNTVSQKLKFFFVKIIVMFLILSMLISKIFFKK